MEKNKQVHCPSCFHNFTFGEIKSVVKNNIICPRCKRRVGTENKISNKIERKSEKLPEQFKQFKTHKNDNPKYIPNSVWPHPDVIHYCKIDYYKYDMKKATGSNI